MGKAVFMSTLQHWSPSQIKTFTLCNRRWAAEKVFRFPVEEEPSAAQNHGTATHKENELHYGEGTPITNGSLLLAHSRGLLPPRGPGILIEHETKDPYLFAANIPAKGFIDLLDARTPEHLHVIDLKTSGDFKNSRTADQLERDPQMLTYAQWASLKFPEVKTFTLKHVYLHRTKVDAKAVPATVSRAHVEDMFNSALVPTVSSMVQVATTTEADFLRIPHNTDSCHAYRKACPFLDRCFPKPADGFAALLAAQFPDHPQEPDMDLFNNISTGINPPDANHYEQQTLSATPPPAKGPATITGPATVIVPPDHKELHLYINALPTKGVTFSLFEPLVQERASIIVKAWNAQVPDAKKVTDIREVEFGKGRAALAASFLKNPPVGVYVVADGDLAALAIEVLTPLAAVVVRGTK